MLQIRSKTALIKSLLFEFHLDRPTVDKLLLSVDEKTLIKACNFVRRYKPYDLSWLRSKIKEYRRRSVGPVRAPDMETESMTPERYNQLKRELDQRVKNLIN